MKTKAKLGTYNRVEYLLNLKGTDFRNLLFIVKSVKVSKKKKTYL